VVPLLTGGGTRLKVLEALALGTPVVSTSKGIEGLDVTDGVHALVADGPDAFAAAVLRVLAEPPLAARLSDAGRALVTDSYTWDAIGRRLLDVVDGALEGTRP
jgi:glycosyltransferase involved in cell wall biosynthesis